MNDDNRFKQLDFYDTGFRDRIRALDRQALELLGVDVNDDSIEIKVVTSSTKVMYFVLPPDGDFLNELLQLQAGTSVGTAGSLSSVSTGGSISSLMCPGTLLCFASAATLGTASTAKA